MSPRHKRDDDEHLHRRGVDREAEALAGDELDDLHLEPCDRRSPGPIQPGHSMLGRLAQQAAIADWKSLKQELGKGA